MFGLDEAPDQVQQNYPKEPELTTKVCQRNVRALNECVAGIGNSILLGYRIQKSAYKNGLYFEAGNSESNRNTPHRNRYEL